MGLDEIAAKLKALRDGEARAKLLWFSEDHPSRTCNGPALFGTPNYSDTPTSATSRGSVVQVGDGADRRSPTWPSKYILLFGWNPTSAIK